MRLPSASTCKSVAQVAYYYGTMNRLSGVTARVCRFSHNNTVFLPKITGLLVTEKLPLANTTGYRKFKNKALKRYASSTVQTMSTSCIPCLSSFVDEDDSPTLY